MKKSITKSDVVHFILAESIDDLPRASAHAFAPVNIALCKYWGKRDSELNLPMTSSLSISLNHKGAMTELSLNEYRDNIILNGEKVNQDSHFYKRLTVFLDLFRTRRLFHFHVAIQTNVPIAAGLASSACGFAALVLALNKLFNWQLNKKKLSILARLGSGSACRSIEPGFIEWHRGIDPDGMDSYAESMAAVWPELCIGLLIFNKQAKNISSRDAMQRTIDTNIFYSLWPEKANQDLILLKKAIDEKDFSVFGRTAESNALTMHSLMLSAWPPICYVLPETLAAMQKIWELRAQGIEIYFTQDAGPNLKLLVLKKDQLHVQHYFPEAEWVQPF